jgi:hypothetical protein
MQKDDIYVDLPTQSHAGVTFTKRGDRIVVTKVIATDMCHRSGVRAGMIIQSINRIPIFTPRDGSNILNTVRDYGGSALIRIEVKPTLWSRFMKKFY